MDIFDVMKWIVVGYVVLYATFGVLAIVVRGLGGPKPPTSEKWVQQVEDYANTGGA